MMMDEAMNNFGMWWMVPPVLVLLLMAAWLLFLILSRPSKTALAKMGVKSGTRESSVDGRSINNLDGILEDMLIVIPDISGYTKFVTRSRFALSHAHLVISELLSAVVAAGQPVFSPMRLEGDAVVFHGDAERLDPSCVGQAVADIMQAFYGRRDELARENICHCDVCDHIAELELKIVIHNGEVLKYRMGPLEDVTGEAMITAHRLLKNRVDGQRYVLVTEPASVLVQLPEQWDKSHYTDAYEGIGETTSHVFTFDLSSLGIAPRSGRTAIAVRTAKDLPRKLKAAFLRG